MFLTVLVLFTLITHLCSQNQKEDSAAEEDRNFLIESITRFGLPQPPEVFGLPGPQITVNNDGVSKYGEISSTLRNDTRTYRFLSENFSYNSVYETINKKSMYGIETLTVNGQICEKILRQHGGYYLRTVGYNFNDEGLRLFLIDVSKVVTTQRKKLRRKVVEAPRLQTRVATNFYTAVGGGLG